MPIIILHGLYMHSIVMHPLRQQLTKLGYQAIALSYNTLSINEEKLFLQIDAALDCKQSNVLVGHSLGGLMIKRYLASRHPNTQHISHVITIGSPLQGASIVSKIEQLGLGMILGNATEYGLKKHHDSWHFPQKLGSIAGTLPIGMRTLLMGNQKESDGTVTVEETKIAGMTDHLETRTTHTSMLYNHYIAKQIDHFIRYDQFEHEKT
ncbi:triacylglycerol lipase [Vibrio sp. V27_P1S3P104]|uniref:PGAP1-like alpha/beta domain-containing protein n=1 Tax=Vibrio TaxID=662 RepID=UPI000C165C3E|nr:MULTISPECIES: cobinamide adenolsyltransferase [Vibrio]NAW69903.1 triacylglycerol lipase [Vibrio sp. V28_P6S34P95]NAX03947.1 triacylglycerol lipase [Vibrio sp. V30_P3S12P165]NAX34154.1 triacylglycerol lipase [Vibrio sp. V29_P1S30P107]NAX36306.1 triacylglycerol lipase [Vibrio sp. V27_P1S3P104]NAX40323.1 triacylglycerol lipase [Vibrio sp. V26_P1S5P106]